MTAFYLSPAITGAALITVLGNCIEPDDPRQIAEAKAACTSRAKEHLVSLTRSENVTFADTQNVTSDPTPDAFEFIWPRSKIEGYVSSAANPVPGTDGVWCRGFTDKRVITFLRVDGAELVGSLNPSEAKNVYSY